MEATTEVHQWILAFFSLVFVGLLVSIVVNQIRVKRRDKHLIEMSIKMVHLNDEVNHLIRVHRYIDPVVVSVNSISGISSTDLLRQGTATTTYPDEAVGAAIRVQEKYSKSLSAYGRQEMLYLDPKALQQSREGHQTNIFAIDGALKEQTA